MSTGAPQRPVGDTNESDLIEDAAAVSASSLERAAAGAWSGAVDLMRHRLANTQQLLGPEHPETVDCLTYLGSLFYDLGIFDEAALCFRRAYAIQAKVLGVDHVSTRGTLGSLVDVLAQLDDIGSAEPLLWKELAIAEKEDGPSHADLHPLLVCLSECVYVRRQFDQAVGLLERALAIIRAHEGDDSEDAIATLERIRRIRSEGGSATQSIEGEGYRESGRAGKVPC